jgi:autotransporter-associated beta strand protein
MKRLAALVTATLALSALIATAQAQQTLYWDTTDGTPGLISPGNSGTGANDGAWDNGVSAKWNPNSDGSGANVTWNDAASPANNAVIDVAGGTGTNATGWVTEDAGISITGTRTTNTVTVGGSGSDYQWVVFTGGGTISAPNGLTILNKARVSLAPTPNFAVGGAVIDTGTNNLTINAGGRLDIGGTNTGATRLTAGGRVVLNGGTIFERNTGNAGSFILQAKNIEVNGTGTIGYDDTNTTPDNQVSILNGDIIFGTGGDPSTGGAGTLIKTGPDQIGFAYRADTGNGQSNAAQNSFAKLKVIQGTFRLRNGAGVIDERLFGAVPTAPLADAITLDGAPYTVGTVNCPGACAGIGTNQTVALHANRGITFGPNGGYFDNGAGAGLTIPGPISGSGPMAIGSPTTTSAANVTFALSNTNNVNTFSGDLIGYRATLKLSSSLKVNGLKDGSSTQQPTNQSAISIDSGNTLTVGVSGGGGTWSTVISGAGGFTKMGAGTETLTAINTYGSDTKVQGGTLSISNAYLADAADVYLTTGSIFNLNFAATDTIRSLFVDNAQQAAGTWGGTGSGAANISPLITGTGLLNVTTGAVVGLPGDYNSDGKVDAADYVLWRKSPGTYGGDPAGYNTWRANYGNGGPGSGSGLSAGQVPEPTTLIFASLAIFFALAVRKR